MLIVFLLIIDLTELKPVERLWYDKRVIPNVEDRMIESRYKYVNKFSSLQLSVVLLFVE